MNDYIELRVNITPCDEIATDILAALLAEGGYESFVPDATGLTAYIPQPQFDREETDKILAGRRCLLEFNAGVVQVAKDVPAKALDNVNVLLLNHGLRSSHTDAQNSPSLRHRLNVFMLSLIHISEPTRP